MRRLLGRRGREAEAIAPPSEEERLIAARLVLLRDATALDVMTPRVDVIALEAPVHLADLAAAVRRSGRSHYPVYEGDLDHLLGVIFVKDLFPLLGEEHGDRGPQVDVTARSRDPYLIPESRPALEILSDMRRGRRGFALVVDEHGGLSGVLTINDLVSALVGELHDEFDRHQTPTVRRIDANRYLVEGQTSVTDARVEIGVDIPDGEYVTVAGYLLDALGHIPDVNEEFELRGVHYKITAMDRLRIASVVIETPSTTMNQDSGVDR